MGCTARSRPAGDQGQGRYGRQDLGAARVSGRAVRADLIAHGAVRDPPDSRPRRHRHLLFRTRRRPAGGHELQRRARDTLRHHDPRADRRAHLADRGDTHQPRNHGLPHAARPAGDSWRHAGRSGGVLSAAETRLSAVPPCAPARPGAPAAPYRPPDAALGRRFQPSPCGCRGRARARAGAARPRPHVARDQRRRAAAAARRCACPAL